MVSTMEQTDMINVTVVDTPKPKACSTATKKEKEKNLRKELRFSLINYTGDEAINRVLDSSIHSINDSMGHLSCNDPMRDAHIEESIGNNSIPFFKFPDLYVSEDNKRLKSNKQKIEYALERIAEYKRKKAEIALTSSTSEILPVCESTVSETDLLATSNIFANLSAIENVANTSSVDKSSDLSAITKLGANKTDYDKRMSKGIHELSNKVRHSSTSLKDLLEEYKEMSTTYDEMNSDMFLSASEAVKNMMKDEQSWHKQYSLPVSERTSMFSNMTTFDNPKQSIGEFFIQRSDDNSFIFHKSSPEKRFAVPLIETSCTTLSDDSDTSIAFSLSKIRDLIANDDSTPIKVVETLMKNRRSDECKLRYHKKMNSPGLKKYTSNLELSKNRTSDDTLQSGTLSSAKSMSSILNKENLSQTANNRSSTSVRTASSIETLAEGKLPIVCTREELIFGCVQVGCTKTLSFTVKNRSHQRLRFQVATSNPIYKISNIETDLQSGIVLLHPMESRLFTMTFTPLTCGAQMGKLCFSPVIKGELRKTHRQTLMCAGYGGHAKMVIRDVNKETTGKISLPLGIHKPEMKKTFTIQNTGTLPGFAYICHQTKGLCSSGSRITVVPDKIVLKPTQRATITVTCVPSHYANNEMKKHFVEKKIDVFQISMFTVISGSEVTRGRLRRLHTKLKNQNIPALDVVTLLAEPFAGECIPEDVKLMKENNVSYVTELVEALEKKDIALTIEYDPDQTLVAGGIDETSVYHTLWNNQTNANAAPYKSTVSIEPQLLVLMPPSKKTDNILLTCDSTNDVQYEIKCEPEGVIGVTNRMGIISPSETKVIQLSYMRKQLNGPQSVSVLVYTENDILEVMVKIMDVKA